MAPQFMTPAVSVFDDKGRLDIEQNQRLYEHLICGGVSGLVILGSIGEFCGMDMATSMKAIDIATGYARGRLRLFAGASRMDPAESVTLANYAADRGVDGVMIVSPYYFRLGDDAIYDYYRFIASRVSANIFLYNFPDRTGYSLSPAVALRLARDFPNIRGLKDTVPDVAHTAEVIRTVTPEVPYFEVFSGFDNNFAHNILSGGAGCIGGLSNIVPGVCAAWMAALEAGDLAATARYQRIIDRLMAVYAIGDPFIPIVKKALVLLGVIRSDVCTRPMLPPGEAETVRLRAVLEAADLCLSR
ncbi:MAG: dihydrodipicolinate synthase family protein [Telmatospirillum sp.]|nr:dihydrodipicolinate synthase family protein [Telmatospirillum sp.]